MDKPLLVGNFIGANVRWRNSNQLSEGGHYTSVNTLRARQIGHHFPEDIFKCIFLNENVWIMIKISLNVVPKGPINNISALVQIIAWRRPGDKPWSEPMMVSLLTHICVIRPEWVNIVSGNGLMACCRQAAGHYLNQNLPSSMIW